jgi:hypothetical protein
MANRLIPSGQNEGSVELGNFSFTGVTSISLPTNTFSTAYDNYFIQINFKQITAGNLYLRYRSSGTDISASYYQGSQGWSSAGAAINRSVSNGAEFIFNGGTANKADDAFFNSASITLFNPLTTGRKNMFYDYAYWNSSDTQNSLTGGGFCSSSSTADSATLYTNNGTITGFLYVYGMRK